MPDVRVRDANPSEVPDAMVRVRLEAPICKCHGLPEIKNGHRRNGSQKWVCAIWRRERARHYNGLFMADPVKAERRRAQQREKWPARTVDPLYQLQRQLNDMARVRVR
jgi:hypothetical protein